MTALRRVAGSLCALALACAAGPAPRAPVAPAPSAPAAPAVASGRYGDEPEITLTALERGVVGAARDHTGRGALRVSPSLVLAARALAARAAQGERDPLGGASLRTALAGALAFDPAPTAHLSITSPAAAARAVTATIQVSEKPTHAGAGAVVRGDRAFVVLLLARRTVVLQPFPREVEPGAVDTLSGGLVGLHAASVHVTSPDGRSRELPVRRAHDDRGFETSVAFDRRGRWLVEVVGRGEGGPEVAALLPISCGGAPLVDAASAGEDAEPADPAAAEVRVSEAIDALRSRQGLPSLTTSAALADVARRHSQAMLAASTVAHVLPGSGSVGERLRLAGVPYLRVSENVARGASALAAHQAAEESPAHRENILTRTATLIGCGIARGRLPTGEPIVYLTEIFVEPPDAGADDRVLPDTRVREALWRERERLRLPPLVSDPALDALARQSARDMARAGVPGAGPLARRALELDRRVAAVDTFVVAHPSETTRSKNVRDPRLRRVGVGVERRLAPAGPYGAGLLWIAVVYTN